MTNNNNYIKIELECYTESGKDEVFALVTKNFQRNQSNYR